MNTIAGKLLLAGVPVADTSPDGGQSFIFPGTYTYKVPDGVTYISAVAIGAGGPGGNSTGTGTNNSGGGGGGGALAYSNKIPVTPGEVLYVRVGNSRIDSGVRASSIARGNVFSTDYLLYAAPGMIGAANSQTGSQYGVGGAASDCIGGVRFSGGNGGAKGAGTVSLDTAGRIRGAGGGGAAGYNGTGGSGAQYYNGTAGSGGGGGGGAAGADGTGGTSIGGLGGGTGIYGIGSNGAGGTATSSNLGILAGDTGSALDGGTYNSIGTSILSGFGGGGGGGNFVLGVSINGSNGVGGAVRIIHGINKTYPVNSTENVISMVTSMTSNTSNIQLPSDIKQGDCLILLDLADYSTSTDYANSGSTPSGWTSIDYFSSSSTYTKFNVSCLNVTQDNITGLPNSSVIGMGGPANYISKILLQFRGSAGYVVYDTSNYGVSSSNYETSAAPANYSTNTSLFQYSRGVSIVIAFFKGTLALVPGTDITHSGATFVQGPSNLSYASYRIYPQTATATANSITMLDKGVNSRFVCMITGY